jgi:hypothetical protein
MPIKSTCRFAVKHSGARKLLAQYNFAAKVEPDPMKDFLTQINADAMQFRGTDPPYFLKYRAHGWGSRRTIPLTLIEYSAFHSLCV